MRAVQCSFLLPIVGIAVLMDVRTGRIPNWLIVAGLAIGWCVRLVCQGVIGVFVFPGGVGIPIILCSGLYYFRMIGAGDIKLFAVVGGFIGAVEVVICMAVSVFAGGILAAILIILRRDLRERLMYFKTYCHEYLTTGVWRPYIEEQESSGRMIFSIPILIGVLCYAGGLY